MRSTCIVLCSAPRSFFHAENGTMKWITAADLERWAEDRLDSRTLMAGLVADLIRATVPQRSFFRFPNGDKGQLRGFDGDLEVETEVELVPGGKSKWEFGVSDGLRKAQSDYEKKTATTPEVVRKENTLVLVTPRSWDTPRHTLAEWLTEKKAAKQWRDVRYIDGPQLEHWLDDHPAVGAYYARQVLGVVPSRGARSTDEFWEEYRLRYNPYLTETVALAGRDDTAKALVLQLGAANGCITVGAESAEEVALLTVCAIRTSPQEERLFLEARTLVIDTAEAAADLANSKGLAFIAIGPAADRSGQLAAVGPTVVAATGVHRGRSPKQVSRPSATEMAEQLQTMGYERDKAYALAKQCGRSLTVLQRLIPNGAPRDAAWSARVHKLKPALMLGGWSTKSKLDLEVVIQMSGDASYDSFEAYLREAQLTSDPPLDNVADVWQVRSPVDAFPYYGHLLTRRDLDKLRELAIRVFSHTAAKPSPQERFQLEYVAPEDYSPWLRRGLASTLILVGELPATGNLQPPYEQWQQYVEDVISAVPEFSRGHLLNLANQDEFALIAEAAPESFVRALEQAVAGAESEIRLFFTESDEMFAEPSPHLGLLDAIERIAWSSKYLPRLVLVLARLAEVDPGGRYSNRPIETLRVLLLPWAPQTYAPLHQRIACLDSVIEMSPEVGWSLLVKLLPDKKSMSPTAKTTIRDFSPPSPEILTYAIVWEANTAIATRAATAARGDVRRLTVLIEHLAHLSSADRHLFLDVIEDHLQSASDTRDDPIWHALRKEVQRHSYFSSADWAIKGSELAALQQMVEQHAPDDPIALSKLLFDDWNPYLGTYGGSRDDELIAAERLAAVRRVWTSGGIDQILTLAAKVEHPELIVEPLVASDIDRAELVGILRDCLAREGGVQEFGRALNVAAFSKFGNLWLEELLAVAKSLELPGRAVAALFTDLPPSTSVWNAISSFGEDAEREYWVGVSRLPKGIERRQALDRLVAIGRASHAIRLAAFELEDIPSITIAEMLRAAVREEASVAQTQGYVISKVLGDLRRRSDLPDEEIAAIEFAYFPALERSADSDEFVLHRMLKRSPDLYVHFLAQVFRAEGEQARELNAGESTKTRIFYDVLMSLSSVPGQSGNSVDGVQLTAWTTEVRRLADAATRLRVADVQLGQLLAQTPPAEDGTWPVASVAAIVETTASENLERGMVIGRINLRGAFTRAFYEGGKQEREIAATYEKWATSAYRYPRVAKVLRAIASSYLADAAREDASAEKSKLLG